MAKKDAQFNHRIPEKLKKEFDEEARANGRSATQHLVHVLKHRNNPQSDIEKLFEFAKYQEIFNRSLMEAIKPSLPTVCEQVKPSLPKKPVVLMNTRILNDNLNLHLTKRVAKALSNGLHDNNVHTVRDLTQLTRQEASRLIGIGEKSWDEINTFVLKNGFKYINH